MKLVSEILFIVLSTCFLNVKSQEPSKDTSSFNGTETILKEEMLRVSRIDTIEKSSKLIAIMGFDADNRVVRKESQFYSKEIDLKWSQVELFNSKGNIVLEINEGIIPCRHSFEYDNQNRLIVEKFFAFGIEEKKIEYKYDNKGKLLEKVES